MSFRLHFCFVLFFAATLPLAAAPRAAAEGLAAKGSAAPKPAAQNAAAESSAAQSPWVHFAPDGRLVYAHSPAGDRIADFSSAGYRGGGVSLPVVPARVTVKPSGGDDTAAIQSALDAVSKLPLVDGLRGAVQLAPGVFHCDSTLNIAASGVELRGAGPDEKAGTTIELTGQPHLALKISGEFHQRVLGAPSTLTDSYVPSGATLIHVADASAIHPGDTLLISKPVTPAWLKFMGMDKLHRTGREEKWVGVTELTVRRRVAAIEGNAVTLDVPLTDDIDAKFFPGVAPPVARVEITGQIAETAVEDLRIVAPSRAIDYRVDAQFDGIVMANAVDSWIRRVRLENTTNSVSINPDSERITVKLVDVEQNAAVTSSAKNFQFSCNGTQALFDRCTGRGDNVFYFATQARQQGPVVVLHGSFQGNGHIQPHQRWSTGLLVDSCDVPGGGIDLKNRGAQGSGHGWATGWSVLWNDTASSFLVQEPPGAANWAIGDIGEQQTAPMPTAGGPKGKDLPRGIVDSPGKPVAPPSLYLEQLRERLGPAAVQTIGYGRP